MLAENGALSVMIDAGARILESCMRTLHRYGSVT